MEVGQDPHAQAVPVEAAGAGPASPRMLWLPAREPGLTHRVGGLGGSEGRGRGAGFEVTQVTR